MLTKSIHMKKTLLVILFLTAFFTAQAQFSVGFETGPIFSRMKYVDNQSNNDHPDGIHLGYFGSGAIQSIAPNGFGFHATFGYLLSGGSGETYLQDYGGLYPEKLRTSIGFLSYCITARKQFPVGEKTAFYIGFGPRVDVYLSYTENYLFFKHFDQMHAIEAAVWGARAESGFTLMPGRLHYGFGAALNLNFKQLVDFSQPSGNALGEWKHDVWLNYFFVRCSIAYRLSVA